MNYIKVLNFSKKSDFWKKRIDTILTKNEFITRQELSAVCFEEITTQKIPRNKIKTHKTSGSSGLPLNIYFTKIEFAKKDIDFLICYLRNGYSPFDTIIALRDPVDIKKPNLIQKLGLIRHFYLNVFENYEKNINRLVENFANKTIVLKGHASDLCAIATYSEKLKQENIRVKMIISDSEVLETFMYEQLSQTFNCPILDTYASVECGLIGYKLYGRDLDFRISKKIRLDIEPGESNEMNRIIITKLGRYFMPIIRYEIGDYTSDIPQKNVKLLKNITGKYIAILRHENGNPISGHLIKQEISNNFNEILRFQVIQKSTTKVEVNVTTKPMNNMFIKDFEMRLISILNIHLGNLEFEIHHIDLFQNRTTRKFHVIKNEIN